MNEFLIRIGIILLWILFANFCMFFRVLLLDRERLTDGKKYFTITNIMFHVIATLLGVIIGIEPLFF
ncbi:MAG: hypothetical protein FWE24_10100 [Defluviitaleaceae bacterium]|nr:hypothetical protein [Defluviitaleaceae bacterium]